MTDFQLELEQSVQGREWYEKGLERLDDDVPLGLIALISMQLY